MIKFSLCCKNDHDFEAWFRDNADFETQHDRGLVTCPICGSSEVGKQLMAPSVSTGRQQEAMKMAAGAQVLSMMRDMTKHVKENAENVGDNFAEEARKIHYGEADARGIYGKATMDEATELQDEGVDFMPLPDIPDEEELN